MKNILTIIIMGSVLSTYSVFAQFEGLFASANQQLIREAVEDGFFVVRQYYQLQDTTAERPSYFGRQGNPYFGCVYGLAVKGGPGYYADEKIIQPWMYDSAFNDFRGSVKFVPVLFKAQKRAVKENIYHPLFFCPDSCQVISNNVLYAVSDKSTGAGFHPDTLSGVKNGWIVLVTSKRPLTECDSAEITLEVYREKLEIPAGKTFCEIRTPSTSKFVLGGIYLKPEVISPGQIVFRLVGFVSKTEGKWGIIIPEKQTACISLGAEELLTPVPVSEVTAPDIENPQKKNRKRR